MGLLDDPYRSLDLAREATDAYMPAHDELARRVARDSIVMLQNDGVLPLKKAGQKLALIGWWAEDRDNAEGVGVIWGNARCETETTVCQNIMQIPSKPTGIG